MGTIIPCRFALFIAFILACLYNIGKGESLKIGKRLEFSAYQSINGLTYRTELAAKSMIQVTVNDVPFEISKIVFGAHTQRDNITMSLQPHGSLDTITGKNIGLVYILEPFSIDAVVWLSNSNNWKVMTQISIVPYDKDAPVPGGCNMEFPVQISPFLRIRYSRVNTKLEFQHASVGYGRGIPPPSCESYSNFLSYDIYVYFLKEKDYSELGYLDGLDLMSNLSSIKQHGKKVTPLHVSPVTRALFLSYPGQGVIYNVIAKYGEFESAYVPIATYECSFNSEVDGCGQLDGMFAKILLGLMAFIGLTVCLFGSFLIKLQLWFFGFLASALVSFILLTKYHDMETTRRDEWTIGIGVAGGLLWVVFWMLVRIPVLSLLLNGFVLGFLLVSVVLFTPLGDEIIFRNDLNYWMLIVCVMLLVSIFVLPSAKVSSIVPSSLVGSYVFIVMVDRYCGTMLSYIILNVVKRAVDDNSSLAWNRFPFQRNDIILAASWGCLALLGMLLQHKQIKKHGLFLQSAARVRRRRLDYEAVHHEPAPSTPIVHPESQPLLSPVAAAGTNQNYASI